MSISRNIQDALLTVTKALTSSDGSVTTGDIDLGAVWPGVSLEGAELVVEIPALIAAELNTGDTLTVAIQAGAAAAPTTALNSMGVVITGDGNAYGGSTHRFKLPSDCPRYVNVKFTTAGTTGDMSDKSATVTLRT